MEDKIEVNDYVRTNKGDIGQVIGIFNGHCQAKYHIQFQGKVKVKRQYLSTRTIIKHSKQLIDLIEVGDIVEDEYNKYEVAFVKYDKIYCNDYNLADSLITLREQDIKAILTKESYMANCYKVGGEDE